MLACSSRRCRRTGHVHQLLQPARPLLRAGRRLPLRPARAGIHRGRGGARLRRHGRQGQCVRSLVGRPPATRFLSQRQDHFARQNTRRWQQRFFVNDTSSTPPTPTPPSSSAWAARAAAAAAGGPDRHGTLRGDDRRRGQAGALIAIEHRYYGESIPVPDFSTPNLRFLSSQQALADIAALHGHISALHGLSATNRWVTFGGSYPGMMAAWARTQYPHLIHSVASSAPVFAQLRMQEYQDTVAAPTATRTSAGALASRRSGRVCGGRAAAGQRRAGGAARSVDLPRSRGELAPQFEICAGAGHDPLAREPAQRAFVSALSRASSTRWTITCGGGRADQPRVRLRGVCSIMAGGEWGERRGPAATRRCSGSAVPPRQLALMPDLHRARAEAEARAAARLVDPRSTPRGGSGFTRRAELVQTCDPGLPCRSPPQPGPSRCLPRRCGGVQHDVRRDRGQRRVVQRAERRTQPGRIECCGCRGTWIRGSRSG